MEKIKGKSEKIPAWQLTKVRNKTEVIAEARTKGPIVHFASLMDICHLKNAEFKETIKNARKKLETSVAPAMPCEIMKNCGSGASNKIKTKLACILEADESTRLRMGNSISHHHEDHIAGKGENSLQHYNLVHKFIPMPQALNIPDAKAAVDKEWEKLEKISAWNLTKVRNKNEVIDEARNKGLTVHFASFMDIRHFKNSELEPQYQKYKGWVVLRGDIVKYDSGSYAVSTEQGSSASQMTAATVMDNMSRLTGCDGQAADAVSAYTRLKWMMHRLDLMWKIIMQDVDLGEATSFLNHVYLVCTQRECQISKDIVDSYRTMCESRISARATEQLPGTKAKEKTDAERVSSWSYDMEGHAKKCVERYCELATKKTEELYKVATPCMDDHQSEENESVGELSTVCSQTVLKCLYLARIG